MAHEQSLISIAKERKARRGTEVTEEDVELALAWIRDEIGIMQIAHAFKKRYINKSYHTNPYPRLALALRIAYEQGLLVQRPGA